MKKLKKFFVFPIVMAIVYFATQFLRNLLCFTLSNMMLDETGPSGYSGYCLVLNLVQPLVFLLFLLSLIILVVGKLKRP